MVRLGWIGMIDRRPFILTSSTVSLYIRSHYVAAGFHLFGCLVGYFSLIFVLYLRQSRAACFAVMPVPNCLHQNLLVDESQG